MNPQRRAARGWDDPSALSIPESGFGSEDAPAPSQGLQNVHSAPFLGSPGVTVSDSGPECSKGLPAPRSIPFPGHCSPQVPGSGSSTSMLLQNPQSASSLPGVPESSTGSGRRPNEDLTARSLLSSAPHSQIDTTIVGRSASSTLSSSTAPEAGELLELLPRSQLSLLTHLGELKASGLDGDELGSLTKKVAEVRSFAKGRQRHAAASGDLNSLRDSRDLNSLREQVGLLTEQVNTLQSAPSGVTPSGHAASATSAEEKQLTSMRQQLQGLHLKVQSHEASIDEFVSMRKKTRRAQCEDACGAWGF